MAQPFRYDNSVNGTNKLVEGHAEYLCKPAKLNIGDEAFAALNALNGVFVEIDPYKLHLIGKSALRQTCAVSKAKLPYPPAADIVPAVIFVFEHIFILI